MKDLEKAKKVLDKARAEYAKARIKAGYNPNCDGAWDLSCKANGCTVHSDNFKACCRAERVGW